MREKIIYELLHKLALQDAGCPLQRHELTDREWLLLGALKTEREKMRLENTKHG